MDNFSWIEWKGGACPVELDSYVDVRMQDFEISEGRYARELRWKHDGKTSDIISYRSVVDPSLKIVATRIEGKQKSSLDTQEGGDHYKTMKIQPVEFSTANKLTFLEGCVIKRVCRHRSKNGAEDIRKAIHELNLILELEYGNTKT